MSTERVQRGNLTLLLFPPSMLSLYAQASVGEGDAVPRSYDQALRDSGAEAVLNGPMFEKCNPSGTYASQPCGHVVYQHFDLSSGVSFPSTRSSSGMTISVMPDGSTVAASGAAVAPGARLSVQLYPSLVIQGRPSPVSDQGAFSYVAALAVMSDGRMAFVVGRNMSLPTFARQLADAGAVYAGYTDGGGSASLATLDSYVGSSEHRRVLTWLVAKPSSTSSSSSGLAMAAMALLAIGVGWWALKNATHVRGLPLPRRNPSIEVKPPDRAWGALASWGASIVEGGMSYRLYLDPDSNTARLIVVGTGSKWSQYAFEIVGGRLRVGRTYDDTGELAVAPLRMQMIADELFAAIEERRRG